MLGMSREQSVLAILVLMIGMSGLAIADGAGTERRDVPPPSEQLAHITTQMMNRIGNMFNKARGTFSRQILTVSNPTPSTTQIQMRWPNCISGKAALLATFCVLPTTKEMEADPSNLLPRFSVQVEPDATSDAAIFLFDDDDEAYFHLFRSSQNLSSCAAFADMSSASIFRADDTKPMVEGARSIRTSTAHKWYIVAVDCSTRVPSCSNISHATVQYFHPNSVGDVQSCYATGALSNLRDMKEFMAAALSFDVHNLFVVAGISPFGVSVLYATFAMMLCCSLLFYFMTKWEQEAPRRIVYLRCTVAVTISALSYLAMASGNGFSILRRLGEGPASGWVYSTELMDDTFATKRGYADMLLSTPLLLANLFSLSDLPRSQVRLALFCNTMMCICFFEAAAINAPSEWIFWLFGSLFCYAVVGITHASFSATEKRSRPTRRLFSRIASIIMASWGVYPLIWIVGDGTRALPIDVLLMVYLTWDVLVKCVLGLVLLRGIPDIGTLLESAAHELESVGLKSPSAGGEGYDEELASANRAAL